MGQVAVLVIVFLVCIGVVLLLLNIRAGGPSLPDDAFAVWDWPVTPISNLDCMGYTAADTQETGLLQQLSPDKNGDNTLRWPSRYYEYKDDEGNWQKGSAIARMGTVGHYKWVKDSDGKWVKGGTWIPRYKGDHKDCCHYLHNNGRNSVGVYQPETQLCYTFDHMGLLEGLDTAKGGVQGNAVSDPPGFTSKDYANVFPLHREMHNLKNISEMPLPPDGQYTYMVPCGGEGSLPCDYPTGAAKTPFEPYFVKAGCSQSGRPQPYPGSPGPDGKGTATLYRTPMQSNLPYSDTMPYSVCQSMPWIHWLGWNPGDEKPLKNSKNPQKWKTFQWPKGMPVFDPTDPAPYDFNTSNSRFMLDNQYK